jgi:hypothetical protein
MKIKIQQTFQKTLLPPSSEISNLPILVDSENGISTLRRNVGNYLPLGAEVLEVRS